MTSDRSFLDSRRWYTIETYTDRSDAISEARRLRRANAYGKGRAFRVVHSSNTGKWIVQHAEGISENDRKRGAHFNRRMIEDDRGQRKLAI